jgi:general secretion pathway protein B
MSYILDALRKSEAERSRGDALNLFAGGSPRVRPIARGLIVALVAALAINAAVLIVWLLRGSASTPGPSPGVAEETRSAAVPVMPTERVDNSASPALAAPTETSEPLEEESPRVITPDAGLDLDPANVMAPAIEISTHVYSDDPTLRAVTIDGRRLREGDAVRPGIALVEITESGVVIESDGVRSNIDVLQDWR